MNLAPNGDLIVNRRDSAGSPPWLLRVSPWRESSDGQFLKISGWTFKPGWAWKNYPSDKHPGVIAGEALSDAPDELGRTRFWVMLDLFTMMVFKLDPTRTFQGYHTGTFGDGKGHVCYMHLSLGVVTQDGVCYEKSLCYGEFNEDGTPVVVPMDGTHAESIDLPRKVDGWLLDTNVGLKIHDDQFQGAVYNLDDNNFGGTFRRIDANTLEVCVIGGTAELPSDLFRRYVIDTRTWWATVEEFIGGQLRSHNVSPPRWTGDVRHPPVNLEELIALVEGTQLASPVYQFAWLDTLAPLSDGGHGATVTGDADHRSVLSPCNAISLSISARWSDKVGPDRWAFGDLDDSPGFRPSAPTIPDQWLAGVGMSTEGGVAPDEVRLAQLLVYAKNKGVPVCVVLDAVRPSERPDHISTLLQFQTMYRVEIIPVMELYLWDGLTLEEMEARWTKDCNYLLLNFLRIGTVRGLYTQRRGDGSDHWPEWLVCAAQSYIHRVVAGVPKGRLYLDGYFAQNRPGGVEEFQSFRRISEAIAASNPAGELPMRFIDLSLPNPEPTPVPTSTPKEDDMAGKLTYDEFVNAMPTVIRGTFISAHPRQKDSHGHLLPQVEMDPQELRHWLWRLDHEGWTIQRVQDAISWNATHADKK